MDRNIYFSFYILNNYVIILLQNCQNVKKMAKVQKEGDCVEELFI